MRQRLAGSSTDRGQRFEELEDLCAAAGDKASIAIATMGLMGETLMEGRLVDASRLAGEHMALIQSIGDPALTRRACHRADGGQNLTGEMADVLQWSDVVIDLAEGDRAMGGFLVSSPLAAAYAMRCTARWWLGQHRLARRLQPCPGDGRETPIRCRRQPSSRTPMRTR